MSFAYKKISPSNITITPYKANKQFNIENNALFGNGISLYFGENIPLNQINWFDPKNDDKTTNGEYKRLVFESIKHLYYKDYMVGITSSLLENNTTSSYESYSQTTLYSGSFTTNLRRLSNITGSSFQGKNSLFDSVIYDSDALYDDVNYNSGYGNLVNIISIDKNIYGSEIKPYTFIIDQDGVYIRDDGEGNIFNYGDKENYNEIIKSGIPSGIYIGNIFYSMGIIIINHQDYVCILGSPPTTVNDYYNYKNLNQPLNFDILANDKSDCGGVDFSSLELVPIEGNIFLDAYIGSDSLLYIIENQKSYVPGIYQINYKVKNNDGLESNLGLIELNISQDPLQIINLDVEKNCFGNTGSINYSFSINDGVPEYEYAFGSSSFTHITGFSNISLSGSIPYDTSILYVRDYYGTIISQSFNNHVPEITYNYTLTPGPSCFTSSLVNINSNGLYLNIDSNPTPYSIPFNNYITTGSHNIKIFNSEGCNVNFNINVTQSNAFNYNIISQSLVCNNGTGSLKINYIGNVLYPGITVTYPNTSQSLYNTSSLFLNNLNAGTYNISINDGNCIQSTNSIINSYSNIIITSSISYANNCLSTLILNTSGGVGPYTYIITSPTTIYNSSTSTIPLLNDGLNSMILNILVTDKNGCTKNSTQEVYGRKYIYSGSYCEQS